MKSKLIWAILLVCIPCIAQAAIPVRVKAHTTKRWTYVAPHYRTKNDKTEENNFSKAGNYNPYTGKIGTRRPKK